MWNLLGQFARSYWIAVQRIGKDARARKFVLAAIVGGAAFFVYIGAILYGAIVWIPNESADRTTAVVILASPFVSLLVGGWMVRRSRQSHYTAFGSALSSIPVARSSPDELPEEVATYLRERIVILASLVIRGGAEVAAQHGLIPAHQVELARQASNAMLRENGLRQKLESVEQDLMGSGGGSWSIQQQNLIVALAEHLRLLRWVLRADPVLVPLAHQPEIELALTRIPAIIETGKWLRPWDVRQERDLAGGFVARLLAEQRHRGQLPAQLAAETESWAEDLRRQNLGASRDWLVGAKSVENLSNEELAAFAATAVVRWRYCSYLTDQLGASQALSFSEWEATHAGHQDNSDIGR